MNVGDTKIPQPVWEGKIKERRGSRKEGIQSRGVRGDRLYSTSKGERKKGEKSRAKGRPVKPERVN